MSTITDVLADESMTGEDWDAAWRDAVDGETARLRETVPTLDDFTAQSAATLRRLLETANASDMNGGHDDRHAWQRPGHLYGDVSTALVNLLTFALGSEDIARDVNETLIDHYQCTPANVREVIEHVWIARGLAEAGA